MIKDLIFGGIFTDPQFKVEAILINPTERGYAEDVLLFEVRITMFGKSTTELDEWAFFIVGGQNRIYNAEYVSEQSGDNVTTMTLYVAYKFRPEYLYNNLRLAFLYKPNNCIDFIEISH